MRGLGGACGMWYVALNTTRKRTVEKIIDFLFSDCFAYVALFSSPFLVVGLWVGASSMEASDFNRVTGKNVSTWDAMWISLRVQDASAK
jgi:hypothetical protein